MKNLPKFIFILSLLFSTWNINAQWITMDSIKVIPAKLLRDDTAGIILAFHTAGTGKEVFFEHTIVDTTIFIRGCYTTSGTATNTYHHYYISLGKLKDQSYSVIFKAYRSFDDTQCTYHDSIRENLYFIVYPPLSVNELKQEPASIYPNPAKNILRIRTTAPIKKMSLYSISGKPLEVLAHKQSAFNISFLPPGMYFLYIDTEKGKYIERFIKE